MAELDDIRSFVAVARHLSFTRAADELAVTQGAVSRMMQTLQADLGVELIRRVGRGIELTPTGAAFYGEASAALDRIAAAARAARAQEGGVLRVSALPTLTQRWLIPRLKRFQAENPDIQVEVSIGEHRVDESNRQRRGQLCDRRFRCRRRAGESGWSRPWRRRGSSLAGARGCGARRN